MRILLAPLISVALFLVGCASPAPVAQNFPLTHQKLARTAHHWDVVAQDVVAQTLKSIAAMPQLRGRPVFVAPARGTAFDTAFREFAITRLVDQGADVSVCRQSETAAPGFTVDGPEVVIRYHTQLVRHGATVPAYQPPRYTLLAAGVSVIRNVILGGDETSGIIGGIALGEWGAGHLADQTRTEIIVTTTIVENNRFLARKSDVYYVPDGDLRLFVQRLASRSACPDSSTPAVAHIGDEATAEIARQDLIERAMWRLNPQWRSTAAYSH